MTYEEVGVCEYCFGETQCRDHVIPVSYLGEKRLYDRTKDWIVDCCNECNTLAGSKVFFSIPEKAEFILKRFKAKSSVKKVLQQPEWTEKELDEVDYGLRQMIFAHIVGKRVAIEKIKSLKITTEQVKDYLMPDFIKLRIKEWRLDNEQLIRENKKRDDDDKRRRKICANIQVLREEQNIKAKCISLDKRKKNKTGRHKSRNKNGKKNNS